MRRTTIAATTSLVLAALAAAGCAQRMAMNNERTLAAAGFQMKLATTPERMQQLEALPQRTLTPVPHEGTVRFVYADAKYCRCLYVGDQHAYDRYQRLEFRQRIAEEREAASMDWRPWGPWAPWW